MSKGKDRKAHLKDLEKLLVNYRVDSGDGFKQQDFDPSSTDGMEEGKERAQELLVRGVDWLSELEDRHYAQDKYA